MCLSAERKTLTHPFSHLQDLKDPNLRQAIINKVNYAHREPASYEELQIKLFGQILDPVPPTTPGIHTPPRISTPPPRTTPSSRRKASLSPLRGDTKKAKNFASPNCDLSSLFDKMSIQTPNEYYGNVDHDESIIANLGQSWRNRDVQIFEVPNILVGSNPSVLTSTITFLLTNIDSRWFDKSVDKFVPFKLTQTGVDTVVLERPWASFDFFYGPRMTEQNAFDPNDIADAFIISSENNEQFEYEIMRNKLVDTDNEGTHVWRERLQIKFKDRRLDYQIINPTCRRGEVPMEFVFAPVPGIKWRIACVPEEKRVLRPKEKESNSAADLFAQYKKERAAILQKAGQEQGSF